MEHRLSKKMQKNINYNDDTKKYENLEYGLFFKFRTKALTYNFKNCISNILVYKRFLGRMRINKYCHCNVLRATGIIIELVNMEEIYSFPTKYLCGFQMKISTSHP